MALRACYIADQANRRRFRSRSTGRSIRCACADIARRGVTHCASTPASREVVLTMPPRGSVREARDFAQKHGAWIAARLKRLPQAAPFAHGTEVPLRGDPHRIVHRRGVRGTVWITTEEDGSRLLCVAVKRRTSTAGSVISCGARGARSRCRGETLRQRARCRDQADLHPRPVEPLGIVLQYRRAVVLLASDPGSALCARLLAAHEVAHLVELNHSPRSGGWSSGFIRISSVPRSGSRSTAPIYTVTACWMRRTVARPIARARSNKGKRTALVPAEVNPLRCAPRIPRLPVGIAARIT